MCSSSVWHHVLLKYLLWVFLFLLFFNIFSYISFNIYEPCIVLRYDRWIQLLVSVLFHPNHRHSICCLYNFLAIDQVSVIYSKSLLLDTISGTSSSKYTDYLHILSLSHPWNEYIQVFQLCSKGSRSFKKASKLTTEINSEMLRKFHFCTPPSLLHRHVFTNLLSCSAESKAIMESLKCQQRWLHLQRQSAGINKTL